MSGRTTYLQDADCTLWHGDVLDVLREMDADSVDCVVCSPPYWGLRSYLDDGHADKPLELGLEATPELFVERLVAVFREVRRVLCPHGTCWVNLGDSYSGGKTGRDDAASLADIPLARGAGGALVRSGGRNKGMLEGEHGRRRPVPPGLKPKDLVGIPWRVAFALQQPYYAGRIKDERDRIWLAATIEAEGCLFIHKRKAGSPHATYEKNDGTVSEYVRKNDTYGAGLEVASTDRVIVERCMAITGIGSICEQSPDQNARRKQTIYRWNVRSNECRWIISELYPHLIAKQHEARLLIGCPSSGDDARKAWESLKALHQGQTASIDFAPPEGMWERGWFLRSEIIWAKLCRTPCPNPSQIAPRNLMSRCFC